MISVVIPCCNAESTIVKALDSVLSQSEGHPFELIVVNDGSSDRSEQCIQAWAEQNRSKIAVKLITQQNRGVSSARNRGIREASGEWIAFLDSDDCWVPEKTEMQRAQLRANPEISFLAGNRNDMPYRFPGKGRRMHTVLSVNQLLLSWHIHISTVIARKDLMGDEPWFDESMNRFEDADFLLRAAEKTEIHLLGKTAAVTGGGKSSVGSSGLSQNMPAMREGERKAVKKALDRGQINRFQYLFFTLFQEIKYRIRKSSLRKIIKY